MFSKKNRILCYLLTLLPAVLGIAVKRLLPGVEDSGFMWPVYMPLGMVVFEMLLFRLMDSMGENREKNRKINGVVMWIFPVLSNVLFLMSFALSTGVRFSPGKVVSWLLGVLFLVIGNYLPKCRQNSTVGIRIPWTFASEANWNATHRMAGPIWMAAGLVMLIGSFFREEVMVVVMFATIAIAGGAHRLLLRLLSPPEAGGADPHHPGEEPQAVQSRCPDAGGGAGLRSGDDVYRLRPGGLPGGRAGG